MGFPFTIRSASFKFLPCFLQNAFFLSWQRKSPGPGPGGRNFPIFPLQLPPAPGAELRARGIFPAAIRAEGELRLSRRRRSRLGRRFLGQVAAAGSAEALPGGVHLAALGAGHAPAIFRRLVGGRGRHGLTFLRNLLGRSRGSRRFRGDLLTAAGAKARFPRKDLSAMGAPGGCLIGAGGHRGIGASAGQSIRLQPQKRPDAQQRQTDDQGRNAYFQGNAQKQQLRSVLF